MNDSIYAARRLYEELGFDTLPLVGGSKKPYARAWHQRLPYRLWQNAPENANLGIRGGGLANVAIIDCDEPRTFENVTNHLAGLGYRGDSYPVIQTASRVGRHLYITLADSLPGDTRNLSREIGAGEFRYGSGAFVVAPPSIVLDGRYQLLSGEFSIRPKLEATDILPLLGNREITVGVRPNPSRKAGALLNGRMPEKYKSRSEAEQSLIASLVNSGFAFGEVLDLFNHHPCAGKFAEMKTRNTKNAERWLQRSYDEAVQWTQAHESRTRRIAEAAKNWAESTPWPGKTGPGDRLVYLAHTEIAYLAGRPTYAAACRDLAERAGVSFKTAARATRRLCNSGLIILDKHWVADSANLYQLGPLDNVTHSLSTPHVRECVRLTIPDAFRVSRRRGINGIRVFGLGKTAYEVWQALKERPATSRELADRTGRPARSIRRVLDRMAKLTDPSTGECLPMVAKGPDGIYRPLPVDLDRIARAVGTTGAGERQRKEHLRERRQHARSLELCRKQTM